MPCRCCAWPDIGVLWRVIWAIQTYMYLYFHGKSNQYNLDVSVWISLFLALIQALTDILWMIVSELLQKIELHREQETANKWECMRLLRCACLHQYVLRHSHLDPDQSRAVFSSAFGCTTHALGRVVSVCRPSWPTIWCHRPCVRTIDANKSDCRADVTDVVTSSGANTSPADRV